MTSPNPHPRSGTAKKRTKRSSKKRTAGKKTRARAEQRYVALLRGVSPMNAKMPELARCFENAGFREVKTMLASGNVVFSAPSAPEAKVALAAEAAMQKELGRSFLTIARSVGALRAILDADPFDDFELAPGAKRVVTFLRDEPKQKPELPIDVDGARILCVRGREVFTAYLPSARGGAFMSLIEKTFGKAVTTRTWGTLTKLAK